MCASVCSLLGFLGSPPRKLSCSACTFCLPILGNAKAQTPQVATDEAAAATQNRAQPDNICRLTVVIDCSSSSKTSVVQCPVSVSLVQRMLHPSHSVRVRDYQKDFFFFPRYTEQQFTLEAFGGCYSVRYSRTQKGRKREITLRSYMSSFAA
jgi:hypothetical protein